MDHSVESEGSIAKDEEIKQPPGSLGTKSTAPRNAFTEMMASKRKAPANPSPLVNKKIATQIGREASASPTGGISPSKSTNFPKGRDGLSVYTKNPAAFPGSRVIYHNSDFVAIHDLYPKASVHTLLLPRSPKYRLVHPFDSLEDAEFLASVRAEAENLRRLVAKELQRRFGKFSSLDRARETVLNDDGIEGDSTSKGLSEGRDWLREVRVGVHAHPSMSDLHIHCISRDCHSESMRHRKHYNSFNTPFFVELDDFPLCIDDPRRHPGREGYLKADFVCWRCRRGFGNQFKKLKEHLELEFDEWKRE